MPILIKNKRKVLFVHIPKTGGTAFSFIASKLGWKVHFSIEGINAKDLNFMPITPQHFHASLLNEVFNLDNFDDIISINRCPFRRMRSEYYWHRHQRWTEEPPAVWLDRIFNEYTSDEAIYDNHIRPQMDFKLELPNVKTFKLEEDGLNQALAILEPEQDLRQKWLTEASSSPKHANKSKQDAQINNLFDELCSPINEFYSDDFASLGYSELTS